MWCGAVLWCVLSHGVVRRLAPRLFLTRASFSPSRSSSVWQVHEYALVLLVLWGYGTKVADMVESGVVAITSDEALEVMALCKGRGFEGLKVRVFDVTVPCGMMTGRWLVGARHQHRYCLHVKRPQHGDLCSSSNNMRSCGLIAGAGGDLRAAGAPHLGPRVRGRGGRRRRGGG